MEHSKAASVADEVIELFDKYGSANYIGEEVTQTEHMLQAAMEAEKEGFPEDVILAAFLHDVGHMLGEKNKLPSMEGWGTVDHEGVAMRYLSEKGFSTKIQTLVRNHVQAKRYLCWKQKEYYDKLSEASKQTLKRQGGPMSDKEGHDFENSGILTESLKMRYWDEAAKELDVVYPPMTKYHAMIIRVLTGKVQSPKKAASKPSSPAKKEKAESPRKEKAESPTKAESPSKRAASPSKKKAAESDTHLEEPDPKKAKHS